MNIYTLDHTRIYDAFELCWVNEDLQDKGNVFHIFVP